MLNIARGNFFDRLTGIFKSFFLMPSKPYIDMNFEIQGGRRWTEFLELMCFNAHTQQ